MAQYLCSSQSVCERGAAFLFRVSRAGRIWPAFVIRFDKQVKGYLNVCAHAALRLQGDSNQLFSRDQQHLICASHGATYEPDTGLCFNGPCKGLSLIAVKLIEKDKSIYFDDKEYRYHD